MELYHFKDGQCEQCGESIEKVGTLQPIHFWMQKENRRIPYYLYVCDACHNSRETWCDDIFPDRCEICNAAIEEDEHYLEKDLNFENRSIQTYGIVEGEVCRVICYDCHQKRTI